MLTLILNLIHPLHVVHGGEKQEIMKFMLPISREIQGKKKIKTFFYLYV